MGLPSSYLNLSAHATLLDPGKRERKWAHLLSGVPEVTAEPELPIQTGPSTGSRLQTLEEETATLRQELGELKTALAELKSAFE